MHHKAAVEITSTMKKKTDRLVAKDTAERKMCGVFFYMTKDIVYYVVNEEMGAEPIDCTLFSFTNVQDEKLWESKGTDTTS